MKNNFKKLVLAALSASSLSLTSLYAVHRTNQSNMTVADVILTYPELSAFSQSLKDSPALRSELSETDSLHHFTVFAPSNQALGNSQLSESTLKNHIARGRKALYASDLSSRRGVHTLNHKWLRFTKEGDEQKVANAYVIVSDIPASNGVIYIVNEVLQPSEKVAKKHHHKEHRSSDEVAIEERPFKERMGSILNDELEAY